MTYSYRFANTHVPFELTGDLQTCSASSLVSESQDGSGLEPQDYWTVFLCSPLGG